MKSVFGLSENIAAAASYIFGPLSGIVVLVMEKENKFVRFHALQSIIWFLILMVAGWLLNAVGSIFGVIPLIGFIVNLALWPILSLGTLLYWVSKAYLAFRAYNGASYKIPIIGEVVWKQING